MRIRSTLALGLLANAAAATFLRCGTGPSSEGLKELSKELANDQLEIRGQKKNVEINTYVHVIAAGKKEEEGYLSQDTVKQQMDLLNKSYKQWNFSFKLIKTTRTINESWADTPGGHPGKNETEGDLRGALREGTYKDLNLFFINEMVPSGMCQLPVPNPTEKDILYDGCLMRPRNFGKLPPDFGKVTVHEVGHWLGLEHTFENGCKYPGDYVDDTPYESGETSFDTCPPKGLNTCPDKPGLDPVDNWMGYYNLECFTQRFTPGQAERMHKLWKKLRAN
ncbi:hypothetical protein F53441_11280 [Fusarium austroafricanum]|uniref:Peptidase M43 pregnancy-associated plasma-A domain-containing protein n=1 Tax=Fusarium austroafricanum TaxID=2364996 RepID=A0A8H4K3E2_9HYPO|nr:hypothetical protein F53441_11280 [Fusarium austroafricanum]